MWPISFHNDLHSTGLLARSALDLPTSASPSGFREDTGGQQGLVDVAGARTGGGEQVPGVGLPWCRSQPERRSTAAFLGTSLAYPFGLGRQ